MQPLSEWRGRKPGSVLFCHLSDATYPLTSGGQPSSVSILGLAGPGAVPV